MVLPKWIGRRHITIKHKAWGWFSFMEIPEFTKIPMSGIHWLIKLHNTFNNITHLIT